MEHASLMICDSRVDLPVTELLGKVGQSSSDVNIYVVNGTREICKEYLFGHVFVCFSPQRDPEQHAEISKATRLDNII